MTLEAIPDTLRELLEPDGSVVDTDDSLWRPYIWRSNTLYTFFTGQYEPTLIGTSRELDREDFSITAVYVHDREDEEAKQRMLRHVGLGLIAKVETYIATVRQNRSPELAGRALPWDHLMAVVDWDFLAEFNVRGFALVCSGYRLRP